MIAYIIIYILFLAAIATALFRTIRIVRAIEHQTLLCNDITGCCESLGFVGCSVVCTSVSDLQQINSLLGQEYGRYEVVIVLDSTLHAEAFDLLVRHFKMVRVNCASTQELPSVLINNLYRSRQRSYRRLILVDAPYRSATITEFWRRWHISLSSWLRDYLYISLGGNRKGRVRTYLNLLITMLLGGLWHGAAVRFILWGALHGIALAVHKMWLQVVPGAKTLGKDMNPVMRLLGTLFTFHLVCLGWLVFRADSMQTAGLMLHQIFSAFDASLIPQIIAGYSGAFLLLAIGYVLHAIPDRGDQWLRGAITNAPMGLQVAMMVLMIWLVMQVKSSDIQPFIYFQF